MACIGRGCCHGRHGRGGGTVVAGLVVRHCLMIILRRDELFVAFFIFNTRFYGFYYRTIQNSTTCTHLCGDIPIISRLGFTSCLFYINSIFFLFRLFCM